MAKENIVIKFIDEYTGLVNIYLPARDEHDVSYQSNWLWDFVKIQGLDLKSCKIGDRLLVDIEGGQRKGTITLIKNLSNSVEPYTTNVVGKIGVMPNTVKSLIGDKVFHNVNFGENTKLCLKGDLVEICVYYNEKREVVKCEMIKNISAIARQPIEDNKQRHL